MDTIILILGSGIKFEYSKVLIESNRKIEKQQRFKLQISGKQPFYSTTHQSLQKTAKIQQQRQLQAVHQ